MTFENVAANLRESFRTVAASRTAGENRELRGVSIASAGVTFQMFNAAFLSEPVASDAELAQRILLANTHFGARGLEWAYWVCEDWLPGRTRKRSRRAFESLGLRHSVDLPGMVAERLAPPVRPLPRLDVRRVETGPVRDAFCAIGALCFHVPPAWFNQVFDSESVWRNFAGYVGYHDDEPVATTAIVLGGGAMGVYNVATVPDPPAPRIRRGGDAPRARGRTASKRDRASGFAIDARGAESLSTDGVPDGDERGGVCELSAARASLPHRRPIFGVPFRPRGHPRTCEL